MNIVPHMLSFLPYWTRKPDDVIEKLPLAGKRDYTHQDIDQLIEEAIFNKHYQVEQSKESFVEEFAADIPTFVQTIFNFNFVYALLSGMAGDVITHFKSKEWRNKSDLIDLLDIRRGLQIDIAKENPDIPAAYARAESALRNFGLDLEDLRADDQVLDIGHIIHHLDIKPEELSNLCSEDVKNVVFDRLYIECHKTRVQKLREALSRPVRVQLRSYGHELAKFFADFGRGLKKNVSNPLKFGTPRAVWRGIIASKDILLSMFFRSTERFDPANRRLKFLKAQYSNSPAEIQHWQKTLEIDESVENKIKLAKPTMRRLGSATAFMVLHLSEVFTESAHELAEGNPVPILINIFSMVSATGPLKDLGEDITHIFNQINSERVVASIHNQRILEDSRLIEGSSTSEINKGLTVIEEHHNNLTA